MFAAAWRPGGGYTASLGRPGDGAMKLVNNFLSPGCVREGYKAAHKFALHNPCKDLRYLAPK